MAAVDFADILPPEGHWKEGAGPKSVEYRVRRDEAMFREVVVILLRSIDEKLGQLLALQGQPVTLTTVEEVVPAKGAKGKQAKEAAPVEESAPVEEVPEAEAAEE